MKRKTFYTEDIITAVKTLRNYITDDCTWAGIIELACELLGVSEESLESTLSKDNKIEEMWNAFGDVPLDENECLEASWNDFPKGTHKEEIWYWFDEHHTQGVGWLMNEYEGGII